MIQHLVKAGLIRDVHLEPGSLRSLHQLSLWVSTLSLHLLAAVPEFKARKGPGFSLLHDGESLQLLRYLLAMVRLWNLSKLNIICMEKEMDLTARLFSMLTRLIKKMEDESLLDSSSPPSPSPPPWPGPTPTSPSLPSRILKIQTSPGLWISPTPRRDQTVPGASPR